jgi:hypothetical protein
LTRITLGTRLQTPTLIGCLFLKSIALRRLLIRHQQRSEIVTRFKNLVKRSASLFSSLLSLLAEFVSALRFQRRPRL